MKTRVADRMHRTRDIILRGIDEGVHSAAQLYVSVGGDVVTDEAFGPISTDHLMLWMSGGKPIAAAAVLMLVARKLITLDTRICDVVPPFAANGKDAITLRHILTHTAGFRGPLNNFTPGPFGAIIDRVCALRQEAGWVAGEKAGYHVGSSWFVLGELIRILDGRPIDRFVREEISGEIFVGMSTSELETVRGRLVEMKITDASNRTPFAGNSDDAIVVSRPGANARGPIRELGRFYERLLNCRVGKDDFLPQEIALQMTTRNRVGMHDATFGQVLDWGLGVMIDSKEYAGEHQYGFGAHASHDTFGHSGNQSSCGFADPKHELVIAWACDGMPGELLHQARQREINSAVYQDLGLV